jgi:hypothetical protein
VPEWVDSDGNRVHVEGPVREDDGLTKKYAWRKHRVPFEKAFDVWSVIITKPGLEGDEFLEETVRDHE